MTNNPSFTAIQAALDNDWEKAVELNLSIIKNQPEDIEALLRLAKAYESLGEIKKAQRTYRKVKKIDKFNPIAKRELIKIREGAKANEGKKQTSVIKVGLFLEEPGKTKTISLIRLAPPEILLSLDIAEEVKLALGKRSITVRDKQNSYLGRLPDDISQRLITLIKKGNQYLVVVKSAEPKMLQIFIKEIKRSSKNANIPSFLSLAEPYHAFFPKGIIDEES